MYGHVNRRDVHFNNAIHIPLLQISQRDVVSVQERQTGIVIFEVQTLAHALRKLVDETEYALIFAGVLFVHQGRLEFQPDIGIRALSDRYLKQLRIAVDLQHNRFFSQEKTVIQHIADLTSVDGDQIISRAQADALRCGGRFYSYNFYHSVHLSGI